MGMFYSGSQNKILTWLVLNTSEGVSFLLSPFQALCPTQLPARLSSPPAWGLQYAQELHFPPSPDWKQSLIFLQAHHFFPRENLHDPSDSERGPILHLLASQPLHCSCYYRCHLPLTVYVLIIVHIHHLAILKSGSCWFYFPDTDLSIYVPATSRNTHSHYRSNDNKWMIGQSTWMLAGGQRTDICISTNPIFMNSLPGVSLYPGPNSYFIFVFQNHYEMLWYTPTFAWACAHPHTHISVFLLVKTMAFNSDKSNLFF